MLIQYDKENVDHYEHLQKEYEKLFTEYKRIKSDYSKSDLLEKQIDKLTEKNKEIQDLSSKLS